MPDPTDTQRQREEAAARAFSEAMDGGSWDVRPAEYKHECRRYARAALAAADRVAEPEMASGAWEPVEADGSCAMWPADRVAPDREEPPNMLSLELAWGLIANAWHGNWEDAPVEWREAAERWRDEHWHKALDRLREPLP